MVSSTLTTLQKSVEYSIPLKSRVRLRILRSFAITRPFMLTSCRLDENDSRACSASKFLVRLCADVVYLVSERILARDPMDEIRRAFQLFDDDNTGKISLRNLRRVAKEIGDRLEDDEL